MRPFLLFLIRTHPLQRKEYPLQYASTDKNKKSHYSHIMCQCVLNCVIKFFLTAHNFQKWKTTFLTCPSYKMYRVEVVGLKSSNYTFKKNILFLWERKIYGNFVKIWYFVNNCLSKVRIWKSFCTYTQKNISCFFVKFT